MRKWIIAAGAATVALAWFAPDDDVVPPAAATPRAAVPIDPTVQAEAPAPAIPAELQIVRRIEDEDAGNLFGGGAEPQAAQPAPLKPAAARVEQPAAAATPAAGAALPFTFLGSYRDGGKTAYLLQADGQDIVARVGDTIAGAYRLDGADDGALSFTYLPRNQPMTLALTHTTGEAN
jgi:hypothetical protein